MAKMELVEKKQIVILGGGFAGVYTYLRLHKIFHGQNRRVRITLINERDNFVFIPMIHEVATGTLLPSSIMQSMRTIPQCCLDNFIEGKVLNIDTNAKTVQVEHLNSEAPQDIRKKNDILETLPYDYLVCALGSDTNFFNVPGAKEYALTLKSIEDAKYLKNRILDSFDKARLMKTRKEREHLLAFVVVGGGPTGVELAGELSDIIHKELKEAFPDLHAYARIYVLEGGTQLVSGIDEWVGKKTHEILAYKDKVMVRCNTRVCRVVQNGVYLKRSDDNTSHEDFFSAGTVIWTAGVRAREIPIAGGVSIVRDKKTQRIKVSGNLQVSGCPELFVIGDQAWIEDREMGQPYPMRAQFAVWEGDTAARNIAHLIRGENTEEFSWQDRGFILSLGKGGAVAQMFGFRWTGPFAWVVYRMGYLMNIVGARAKLRTTLEWILNVFLPRDVSKL